MTHSLASRIRGKHGRALILILAMGIGSVVGRSQPAAALDHFRWDPTPAVVAAGSQVRVSVQAVDAAGHLVPDFQGSVLLEAVGPGIAPRVLITEVETLLHERLELMNVSEQPVDLSGWRLILYESRYWPEPIATFIFPAGTVAPARQVFTVSGSGQYPGVWPGFQVGLALSWGADPTFPYLAARLLDREGRVVDAFCAMRALPASMLQPFPMTAAEWTGSPEPVNQNQNRSYQRVGRVDTQGGADWVSTNVSFGSVNPGLRFPFVVSPARHPVTPATLTFAGGRWEGEMSIGSAGTNLVLRVDDGAGHVGDSGPLDVLARRPLTLILPGEVSEASPGTTASGTLLVDPAPGQDEVIRLTSSWPGEVAVPESVLVQAGATAATFVLTNLDDADLDGPRLAEVMAEADGYESARAVVISLDNEAPEMGLAVPGNLLEDWGIVGGSVPANGRLQLGRPVTEDVRVELRCDPPGRLMVPDSLVIPRGQASVGLVVLAPDNRWVDGNATVVLRATVPGWPTATASVLVSDDEHVSLQLSLPTLVWEGGAPGEGLARVSGASGTDLTVTLESGSPGRVLLPATVVIPAGQVSVPFLIQVVNDETSEADVRVTVSVSAPGFATVESSVLVADDDPHHFQVSGLPPAAMVGQELALTVTCLSASGRTVAPVGPEVRLRAAGSAGVVPVSPAVLGPFTNGVWQGRVRAQATNMVVVFIVEDAAGRTGSSSPVSLVAGRVLDLSAADLVYDESRASLCVGTRSGAGADSRALLGIDPSTGAIVHRLALDFEPRTLALADGGGFLYAGLASTGGVIRVGLPAWTADFRFELIGQDPVLGPEEIRAVPGQPEGLLVRGRSTYPGGIAYYSAGLPGPARFLPVGPWLTGTMTFYGDASRFYLARGGYESGSVQAAQLTTDGVRLVRTYPGFPGSLASAAGLLFASEGGVFDPDGFRRVGTYPARGLLAVDADLGQVFFLDGANLVACDLATFTELGRQALPVAANLVTGLVRCGGRRLAVATAETRLLLIEPDLVRASWPADLQVARAGGPDAVQVGEPFAVSVTLSNLGPGSAEQPVVLLRLPAGMEFVSAHVPAGDYASTNGLVRCRGAALTAGGSTAMTVTMRASIPGRHEVGAWVTQDGFDRPNGRTAWMVTAEQNGPLPGVTRLPYSAVGLAYDGSRDQLWFSTDRFQGRLENSVRGLDLRRGLLTTVLSFGGNTVTHLEPSASRNYLYVAHVNPADFGRTRLRRIDLRSNQAEPDFPLLDIHNQEHGVASLSGLAGFPDGVVVSRPGAQNDIAIYDGSTLQRRSPSDMGVGLLEVNSTLPNRIYRIGGDYPWGELLRLEIGPTAIAPLDWGNLLAPPPAPSNPGTRDVRFGAGYLFSDTGVVADPEAMTRVSTLPVAGQLETDPDAGLVYYLHQGPAGWWLTAFGLRTLAPAWAAEVADVQGSPGPLIGCGLGRVAFATTEDQLYVLNTAMLNRRLEADLALTQSADATAMPTNQVGTFTCVLTNLGPAPAVNLSITNRLSEGAIVHGASASAGVPAVSGNQVVLNLASLPFAQSVTLTVMATRTTPGPLVSLVSVNQALADPVPANNTATNTVAVATQSVADLAMAAWLAAGPGPDGSPALVRVRVSNLGPDPAADVAWTGHILPGASVISVQSSKGMASLGERVVEAMLGPLAAGESATIDLVLGAAAGGLFRTQSAATSATFDPVLRNNERLTVLFLAAPGSPELVEEFPLWTSDIAFDPEHQRIVACTDATGDPYPNSVVALTAAGAVPLFHVPIGEPLNRVVVSGDGRFAYAALAGADGVVRVDLQTREVDLRFRLREPIAEFGPFVVQDMAVLPGSPRTLALARGGWSGYRSAVVLFDDGVSRAGVVDSLTPNASYFRVGFRGAGQLLTTSSFGYQALAVSEAGLARSGELVPGYLDAFVVEGGLLYSFGGQVLDPASGLPAGMFPANGPVAVDSARGRAYFLQGVGPGLLRELSVRMFDAATFGESWSVPLHWFVGIESRLLHLGTNGLALRAESGRTFLFHSERMDDPVVDLAVQQTVSPNPANTQGLVTWTISAQNHGPWTATGIRLVDVLPPGFRFVSAGASVESVSPDGRTVTLALGTLANGALTTFTLRSLAETSGAGTNTLEVRANQPDLRPADNRAELGVNVRPQPALSIADVSLAEGDANSSILLRVNLSRSSAYEVTVAFRTRDGSARAGVDYTETAGVVTIAPGRTSSLLSVPIRGNTLSQSNRFFHLVLSDPVNATLDRAQNVVTVVDDDFRRVTATGVSLREGHAGSTNAVFRFQLSQASAEPVRVEYLTAPLTATVEVDFTARQGTLVFAPGNTQLELAVPVQGDTRPESDESFGVVLAQINGAILATNEVRATILDDDPAPVLELSALNWNGTDLSLRFPTIEGRIYRLEVSEDLRPGQWQPFAGPWTGSGEILEVRFAPTPTRAREFYRVVLQP